MQRIQIVVKLIDIKAGKVVEYVNGEKCKVLNLYSIPDLILFQCVANIRKIQLQAFHCSIIFIIFFTLKRRYSKLLSINLLRVFLLDTRVSSGYVYELVYIEIN